MIIWVRRKKRAPQSETLLTNYKLDMKTNKPTCSTYARRGRERSVQNYVSFFAENSGCFDRLEGQYSLGEAFDFFLTNYKEPISRYRMFSRTFMMPSCWRLRSDCSASLPQGGGGKRGQSVLGDKTCILKLLGLWFIFYGTRRWHEGRQAGPSLNIQALTQLAVPPAGKLRRN